MRLHALLDAQKRLRDLETTPTFEAEATLQWLATAKDLDADTLTDAARAAEAKVGQPHHCLIMIGTPLRALQRDDGVWWSGNNAWLGPWLNTPILTLSHHTGGGHTG